MDKYQNFYNKVKCFNATLEPVEWQCDGVFYMFQPRKIAEIPAHIASFLEVQCRRKGVVPLPHGIDQAHPDFKGFERRALIAYLNGDLRERARNYQAEADEYKRKGVTLEEHRRFKEAMRWAKEIRHRLEMEAPIEEELSFLDKSDREKIGIKDDNVIDFSKKFAGIDKAEVIETAEDVKMPSAPEIEIKEKVPASFDDLGKASGDV